MSANSTAGNFASDRQKTIERNLRQAIEAGCELKQGFNAKTRRREDARIKNLISVGVPRRFDSRNHSETP
jgi:hypothetical protein